MFINSLFLSKLLDLKSNNQPVEDTGSDFNYLFSEIIKVKANGNESDFIPENIGGTLLDHKIIFISNSSPLTKVKPAKVSNEITQLENLYKLFSASGKELPVENGQLNLSLNKIVSDKTQFVKSIEGLIKNILKFNSDNQNNCVEIKYVSKNLIETIKITDKNLSQFSEYLSALIDNNSTFSFVVGANSKQILFDVENLTAEKTEVDLTNSDSVIENVNQKNSEVNQEKTTGLKISDKVINDNSEKFPVKDYQNAHEINSGDDTTQSNKVSQQSANNIAEEKTSQITFQSGVNSIQEFKSAKSTEGVSLFPETMKSSDSTEKKSLEINQHQKDSENFVKNNLTMKSEHKDNSSVIIESDIESKKLLNHSYVASDDFKQLKNSNLGEVKIVIQSKTNNSHSNEGLNIKLENSYQENIQKSFAKNEQTQIKTEVQLPVNRDKGVTEPSNNFTAKSFDNDLPEINVASENQPRISRAGLPLIADYQDWDLVFEKSEKSFNDVKPDQKIFSTKEENQTLEVNPETDRTKQVDKVKSTSGEEQENPIRKHQDSQKVEKETPEPVHKDKHSQNVSKDNQNSNSVSGEKIFNLKFSGEKKIKSISNSDFEETNSSLKANEHSEFRNVEKSQNESQVKAKPIINVKEENLQSDKTFVTEKSDQQKNIKETSFRSDNKSSEQSEKSDLKKWDEQSVKNIDKTTVNESSPEEKEFRNEYQNINRQDFIPSTKANLINSKSVIEHFIKNPVESKTVEKFIQMMDNQSIIQKSEIINYSKLNHSVEIKLAPEELGKIKIQLDTFDNNVNAKIEVNNEQTRVIVVNNLPLLKETLTQQGVNLNNVNVTVTSEEQKGSEQTKQKSKRKSQDGNVKVETTEEKRTVRHLGYNTYEYLA
jgi:flagellar hook-length control protein FliK